MQSAEKKLLMEDNVGRDAIDSSLSSGHSIPIKARGKEMIKQVGFFFSFKTNKQTNKNVAAPSATGSSPSWPSSNWDKSSKAKERMWLSP